MTILLLETLHPDAEPILHDAGRVVVAEDHEEALAVIRSEPVTAILTRGRGQVRRPLLDAATDLKVIARAGVGLDNVDVEAATEHGVPVINSPGSTTVAVAEQTMLLASALVRSLYPGVHAVRSGDWEHRREYEGDDLAGKRLGLIGMGQIARRVARIAAAYDLEVVYWNRTEKEVSYAYLPLDELLASSEIVSVHVALVPQTRHLIGERDLAAMRRGAYLVNTARGAILDQAAVVRALDSGQLGGFAADVLEAEPPDPADSILTHPRALVTPHTAALTRSTYRSMCVRTARNVVAALTGQPVEPGCIANEAELLRGRRRGVTPPPR